MTALKFAVGALKLGVRFGLFVLDVVLRPPLTKLDQAEKRRGEKRRREALAAANRVGRR